MIKKTITILSMLILSAALIWALWEGNAASGSGEDFPSGLFASSDLFPKYTLIEITNLEQNTVSRAVIINNTGSGGLLVKVSPDLAAALAIKEGNTVRVRVSVPPVVAEKGADPVLLGKVEDTLPVPTAVPEKSASEPEIIPAPIVVSAITEPAGVLAQSQYSAEAEKPVPTAASIQEPPVQADSESLDKYAESVPDAAEITVPEESAVSDDSQDPVPEVSTPMAPEPIAGEEEPVKEAAEPMDAPELFAAEPESEIPSTEVKEAQDEPEIVAVAESLPAEDSTGDETVEQLAVLVPSEPRAPNSEDIPLPKETEKPVAPAVTQPAEEVYTANALTKGAFYVQVGRFKDVLNVESFVEMYGKQYPVTIEKSATADVFYKVYVGPLQKDERGAALETFQKLGFKDAFLKKAP